MPFVASHLGRSWGGGRGSSDMVLKDLIELTLKAKSSFTFLLSSGFSLTSEELPTTDSFKDGFRLVYTSNKITVEIRYYDMEYDVIFTKGNLNISYLNIDKLLFDNKSGLHGNMFPREKLNGVISSTAADIEQNYQSILKGDESIWKKLAKSTG
jgi:hypothetical protein